MGQRASASKWNAVKTALCGIGVAFAVRAHAEYRAYELIVENTVTQTSYTLISTLDPQQYIGYYPLYKNEVLHMGRTWTCWGNTANFKPICPPSSFSGSTAAGAQK
jgi:hypothetical protein